MKRETKVIASKKPLKVGDIFAVSEFPDMTIVLRTDTLKMFGRHLAYGFKVTKLNRKI